MNKTPALPELKMTSPGSKRPPFSWEEICMYLYGHVPVEPAIPDDRRKLMKHEEPSPGTFSLVSN